METITSDEKILDKIGEIMFSDDSSEDKIICTKVLLRGRIRRHDEKNDSDRFRRSDI